MLPFLSAVFLSLLLSTSSANAAERLLFEEGFEDTSWPSRGWYGDPQIATTNEESFSGSRSCVWHWEKVGDIKPPGFGGRAKFGSVDNVTLSFQMKHSRSWQWTGVRWHPHEFLFMTNIDDDFMGPAYTHLTFYVEVVNGIPRVAIQDARNIDESRVGENRVGENLVSVTENRSVAGCNGDSDGYGDGDCYRSGKVHRNGKHWEPPGVFFSDVWGDYDKTMWHELKSRIVFNTIEDGVGQKDGIIQMWYDDTLIMDHHDVVFRTGQHPDLRIDKFLMLPYMDPKAKTSQKIWIDDIRITTEDP
jgi:hypothetical protein